MFLLRPYRENVAGRHGLVSMNISWQITLSITQLGLSTVLLHTHNVEYSAWFEERVLIRFQDQAYRRLHYHMVVGIHYRTAADIDCKVVLCHNRVKQLISYQNKWTCQKWRQCSPIQFKVPYTIPIKYFKTMKNKNNENVTSEMEIWFTS